MLPSNKLQLFMSFFDSYYAIPWRMNKVKTHFCH